MDEHNDLPAVRLGVSNADTLRDLGLVRVKPINSQALTDEQAEALWANVSSQEYEFDDYLRGDKIAWFRQLLDKRHLHFDLNGKGYARLENAWCCDAPQIHFCVWDHDQLLSNSLGEAREILAFAFEQMHAKRVTGFIPSCSPLAQKLGFMMGMHFEGSIRQAFLYFGKHYDISVLGMLDREWSARKERLSNV